MNKLLLATSIAMLACGGAKATVLVDLVDAPSQAGSPYSFTLTATSAATTLSFAGYEVPNNEYVEAIALAAVADPGQANLLGPAWSFTPAPSGSDAGQNGDGSTLLFEGAVEGSYDTFSQTIATLVGAQYVLSFNFSNYASTQNALRVTTDADLSTAPEPASWAMMVLGFGLIGGALRYRGARSIGVRRA